MCGKSSAMFHPPAENLLSSCSSSANKRGDQKTAVATEERTETDGEGNDVPLKKRSHYLRAIVQCLSASLDRLVGFLGDGALVATQLNQDRLIYVYDENWFWQAHLRDGKIPSFLFSVIRRVYYTTEDSPVVSVAGVRDFFAGLHSEPGANSLSSMTSAKSKDQGSKHGGDDQRHPKRARLSSDEPSDAFPQVADGADKAAVATATENAKRERKELVSLLAFPRSLETQLCEEFGFRKGGQADRKHVCVYADGLFWLGSDVPLSVSVPERESGYHATCENGAPCSAYWKIREVFEREDLLRNRARSIFGNTNTSPRPGGRALETLENNNVVNAEISSSQSSTSALSAPSDHVEATCSSPDCQEKAAMTVAIDVGAAPGGWSHYLAANGIVDCSRPS
eukprot:GSA25T00005236001.1